MFALRRAVVRSIAMSAASAAPSAGAPVAGPVQRALTERITAALAPVHLEIENESHKHSVPKGSESHFKVFVVSEKFVGQPLIARHRLVNDAVKEADGGMPVHALSISAKTPDQWAGGAAMHVTPNCKGGAGR